jgi:hypothetical protein
VAPPLSGTLSRPATSFSSPLQHSLGAGLWLTAWDARGGRCRAGMPSKIQESGASRPSIPTPIIKRSAPTTLSCNMRPYCSKVNVRNQSYERSPEARQPPANPGRAARVGCSRLVDSREAGEKSVQMPVFVALSLRPVVKSGHWWGVGAGEWYGGLRAVVGDS